MIKIPKPLIKKAAYRSGMLHGWHCQRNREALTVVMFHRVLGKGDPRWSTADPEWTISAELLEECLDFFTKHYNIVGVEEVAASEDAPLPERSLLVTFDDGWADYQECAAQILQKKGIPAVVFVASGYVGKKEPFWQERLYGAWKSGRLVEEVKQKLWQRVASAPPLRCEEGDIRALIAKLALHGPKLADEIVDSVAGYLPCERPEMLTMSQLLSLSRRGSSIGSHGVSHAPLTDIDDPLGELVQSRLALRKALGDEPGLQHLSLPHGRYDKGIFLSALEAGYKYVYTSDACLNPLRAGRRAPSLLGRINICGRDISDASGGLHPVSLAYSLFTRPIRDLTGSL